MVNHCATLTICHESAIDVHLTHPSGISYISLTESELNRKACSICLRLDFKFKKMKIVFGLLKNKE